MAKRIPLKEVEALVMAAGFDGITIENVYPKVNASAQAVRNAMYRLREQRKVWDGRSLRETESKYFHSANTAINGWQLWHGNAK